MEEFYFLPVSLFYWENRFEILSLKAELLGDEAAQGCEPTLETARKYMNAYRDKMYELADEIGRIH